MLKKILSSRIKLNLKMAVAVALFPAMAFSASAVGKVSYVEGQAERIKLKQLDWSRLRVGAPIYQTDRVRTGEASQMIFRLPDGSSISIAENAEVEMTQLFEPNGEGGYETRLDVKKGHINFAVHKLQDKNSKFMFKTGTATASIRGTEGYIGGEGVFFAGLKTGKLEISPDGSDQVVSIVAGETAIGSDSLVVLKLSSSGDARFAKKIEALLASQKPLTDLIVEVQKADSSFQEEKKSEAKNAASNVFANSFSVSTVSPVEVCDQGLLVEGFYRATDGGASLTLKVGSYQSANLVRAADGESHSFSLKVPMTDENGLWNVNKATLTFMGGGVTSKKVIDVLVNKACSDVNTKTPTVNIVSYDSLRCTANLTVGKMQDDAGELVLEADGSTVSKVSVNKNTQARVKLKKGNFEYKATIRDQAGNESSVSKSMGCYPKKHFKIDLVGGAKEVLRVPPPPKGYDPNVAQSLQFRIKIPENTTDVLYKVVVKQNGKPILQETLSQIQNLDYQIPVELERGISNRFDIEVTHKSGFRAKATKVYEVR